MEIAVWRGDDEVRITFSGYETVSEVYLSNQELDTLRKLIEPPKISLFGRTGKKSKGNDHE